MNSIDVYEQLRQHIDTMSVPFPKTESGIEIKLLQYLFDQQEAEIALCVSALAEPATKIHRRYGKGKMTLPEITQILDGMVEKGSIRRGKRLKRGKEIHVYGKLPFAVGMYETQLNKLTRNFENDSREYFHGRFLADFYNTKPVQLRTIPINEQATVEKSVAMYDDIKAIVSSLDGPFAAHKCICTEGMELNGHSCTSTELSDRCISLGSAAVNIMRDGLGTEMSKEELITFFEQAESEGLVIQANNVKDPLYVCCCCKDCCGLLTSIARLPNPGELVTANYTIAVTSDECIGCKACMKRCPMDALNLDDKKISALSERCIGCGLCVSVCPKDVLALKKKAAVDIPLADNTQMHRKMFINRYGLPKAALLFVKGLLGFKV